MIDKSTNKVITFIIFIIILIILIIIMFITQKDDSTYAVADFKGSYAQDKDKRATDKFLFNFNILEDFYYLE